MFKEYTEKSKNLEELDKFQSGNLVGNSLVGAGLVSLCQIWDFYGYSKYPKISKNGNPLFFPVVRVKC